VALTDPIAYPCHLLEALIAVREIILWGELFQLHHDLQLLRVALNVQEQQLGAERSYRTEPS
jgi:hypothetical protein